MSDIKYTADDVATDNGYHFLMRSSSGVIDVYRYISGTPALLKSVATAAIAVGQEVAYRIVVTPTNVNLYRLDGMGSIAYSNENADATHRGAYFHTGHSSVGAEFSEMMIA